MRKAIRRPTCTVMRHHSERSSLFSVVLVFSLGGCAGLPAEIGLSPAQRGGLKAMIEEVYRKRAPSFPEDAISVTYVCTYAVSAPVADVLDPSVERGHLEGRGKLSAATFVIVMGLRGRHQTDVGALCEILVRRNGTVDQSVALVTWDADTRRWSLHRSLAWIPCEAIRAKDRRKGPGAKAEDAH